MACYCLCRSCAPGGTQFPHQRCPYLPSPPATPLCQVGLPLPSLLTPPLPCTPARPYCHLGGGCGSVCPAQVWFLLPFPVQFPRFLPSAFLPPATATCPLLPTCPMLNLVHSPYPASSGLDEAGCGLLPTPPQSLPHEPLPQTFTCLAPIHSHTLQFLGYSSIAPPLCPDLPWDSSRRRMDGLLPLPPSQPTWWFC